MTAADGHATRVLSFLNEVKTGSVVNGRYLIQEQLGSGGMGTVYAAQHVQLGTKMAIKVLLPELLSDADSIRRFEREARAAAKIADENVVRILDVGRLKSGAPYMVMEFLEGQDAAVYLQEHGRLSIEQAIDVLLQACAAVAAAHALDIVHRDIKPSNLFFVPRSAGRPLVKVLDFGVSKILSADSQESRQVTKTGSILGSPGYVAPEQWFSSKTTDKRSDIWALGILLYELLTGRMPFDEDSLPVLSRKIAYDPPVPPRQLREEIPADLEQVVLGCLEKSPDKRFQDVVTLARALDACQSNYQAHRRLTGGQPARVTTPGAASVERRRQSFLFSLRIAAAAVAAVVMVIGFGAFLHHRGPVVAAPRENLVSRTPHHTPVLVPLNVPLPSASAPTPPSIVVAASAPLPAPPKAGPAPPKTGPPPRAAVRAGANHPRLASDGQSRPPSKKEAAAVRCKPPYYFNAKGIRVFKVECL